jgi:hypothetical protein
MPRKWDVVDQYGHKTGQPGDKNDWPGNLSSSAVGIAVLLVIGVFVAAFWLLVQAVKATFRHPKIMLPFLAAIAILIAISIITAPKSSNESPAIIEPPKAATSPLAVTPAVISAATPAIAPTPGARPTVSGVISQWVVIVNTDREGVYLRNSPNMEDKTVAFPEGTRMRVIGPDTENQGRRWKQVADASGRTGWVPAEYTAPASGP